MPKLASMTEAWGTEVSEVVASARRDRNIEDFLGWLFRDGGLEPPRRSYEEVEGVLRTLLGVKSSPLVPAQEERLDELRELSEKATPGPWRAEDNLFLNENWSVGTGGIDGLVAEVWTHSGRDEADAAFIVAAVNYVRAALAQDDALLPPASTTRALGVETMPPGVTDPQVELLKELRRTDYAALGVESSQETES